jgi:hypothetical protein
MKKRTRIVRILLITILGLITVLIIAGVWVSRYAHREAEKALGALDITFSSLDISILTTSVTIENVGWTHSHDSLVTSPHRLTVKKVKASGISIYQLIRNKAVQIHRLSIKGGDLQFNKLIKTKRRQPDTGKKPLIKGVFVDQLDFLNLHTSILNDSLEEYSATVDLLLKDVRLEDLGDLNMISSYNVKSFETSLRKIKINEQGGLYNTRISELYANSTDQKINIDSISLTPKYSKYRFSRKVGRQVDRFTLTIPQLSISGFDFSQLKDSVFKEVYLSK